MKNENLNILKYYSPFSFLRNLSDEKQILLTKDLFNTCIEEVVLIDGEIIKFYYKKLTWDTDYFGQPMYKLISVLYDDVPYSYLKKAIGMFFFQKNWEENSIISIEIPSEDIKLIQALGENGFKLIETRLTYFNDNLKKFEYKRFNVRQAKLEDSIILQSVAKNMRNDFDRFHADQTFPQLKADEYLSTYIENSIKGFSDYVMVPNEENVPCEAFLTANYLKNEWDNIGLNASKMVLSAVSSSCRGWYVKLISEMTYHLRELGSQVIFMNTQSTNKAVIKTWESIGYRYGSCVHILSKNIN